MATRTRDHLVFVYGTLRRGQPNSRWLAGARFVAGHVTTAHFSLLDLGAYPAAVKGGRTALCGELYAIDERILTRLDELEAYPRLYTRERVETPYGPAWIYLLCRAPKHPRIVKSGDWLRR